MSRAPTLSLLADRDPTNPILLCDLLDEWLSSNDVDQALARLRITPAAVRELPGVRFREARCALLRGSAADALTLLQSLLTMAGGPPAGVVHDLAYAQLALGQTNEALETVANAKARGDEAVALTLLEARILHRQQRYADALEVLAPLNEGERLPEIRGLRSLLWLDAGDTAKAAAEAELALSTDPDQYEPGVVRGTLALWARRSEESIDAFRRVLANHPDSGRALSGLGQDLMLRGDIPAARAVLERALVPMPDHIGTWHAMAWCQLLEGDLAGAKQSFDRAFALDRTFGETHGGFALVHALRGEREEAEGAIKRAKRLDPNGLAARYAQSVLLFDEGNVDEARKVIDDILRGAPSVGAPATADFIFRLRDLVRPKG